ncbi:MAG: F0F1 ATP synthase subunit B [Hyphomicrobiaceae bacterium]|nr:F0F1 ATP synthase subunit B [Hyphomicrobiaceae bacterium]
MRRHSSGLDVAPAAGATSTASRQVPYTDREQGPAMASKSADGTHTSTEAHGGAAGASFPPFNTETFAPQLVWLTITFVALYYLMSRIALPRIGEVIEERRDRIQRDLEAAERLKSETDAALASYEKALADARNNATVIAKENRDRLAERVEARQAAVESEIEARVADAERRIGETQSKAMASVNEIATDVAASVVKALVGSEPSADEVRRALLGPAGR